MFDYVNYGKQLRHELHQIPEIGFELPKTLAVVRRELDAMGVAYTEEYGKSSIVATINPGKPFIIGLRGDMDGLPVKEQSNNPFPSQHEDKMHACGHDVHTAQMLAVTKKLNDMRSDLRCCVKILFTPAEEYTSSGCELMAKNGVMDEIDCILACHVDPKLPAGTIGVLDGGMNANSNGMIVEFFGKAAHVNAQEKGIDAIRMAVQAYTAMELIVAREVPSTQPCVLNVGAFNAGQTNNIICDYAKLFLTTRTHSDRLTAFMEQRIRQVCQSVAEMCGGSAKVTVTKLLPYVVNHPVMTQKLRQTGRKLLGQENVKETVRTMGGEDFSFLSRIKPGVFFRLGSSNENNPNTSAPLHNDRFDVDESCMETGISLFTQFVLDNQDGITF